MNVDLKSVLDRLYESFNYPDSAIDPLQIVRRYERPADREIAGFCASGLAFGRVASVIDSTERLLAVMGTEPERFVRAFDPARDRGRLAGLGHRWIQSADLVALLWLMRQMLDRSGSIEGFFLHGGESLDMQDALDSFSTRALSLDLTAAYGRRPLGTKKPGVQYFFPRPSAGSACKRLNLFLRWMVRKDALDLGVWTRVSPARLVVPLDTHVIRVGRCLRLTTYTSPGWAMASEITASLRTLDAEDPVKYDFALCHIGMMNACAFNRPSAEVRLRTSLAACPLDGVCRPRARRRPRSRPPSARR